MAGNQAEKVSADVLLEMLCSKASVHVLEEAIDLGDATVRISREGMGDFFRLLKEDPELHLDMLTSITAVDWMDKRHDRFELVYHIFSLPNHIRLRTKVDVPERNPEVESLCSLWSSANFMEREVWDMYGIRFRNHPNLKRVLMYEEFSGHPLRKDYPLRAKQPRIRLRYPELHNTSLDMRRDVLIKNNSDEEG